MFGLLRQQFVMQKWFILLSSKDGFWTVSSSFWTFLPSRRDESWKYSPFRLLRSELTSILVQPLIVGESDPWPLSYFLLNMHFVEAVVVEVVVSSNSKLLPTRIQIAFLSVLACYLYYRLTWRQVRWFHLSLSHLKTFKAFQFCPRIITHVDKGK